MVKNYIFGALRNTVTIASTRALQHLFLWGSGSNANTAEEINWAFQIDRHQTDLCAYL